MSDLISRQALLKALVDVSARPSSISAVHAAPAITPQVVCNITGGVLQGASADYPVDVYALDFDYNGEGRDEAIEIDGSEAWRHQDAAAVEPEWVKSVIDAPTLAETDKEPE